MDRWADQRIGWPESAVPGPAGRAAKWIDDHRVVRRQLDNPLPCSRLCSCCLLLLAKLGHYGCRNTDDRLADRHARYSLTTIPQYLNKNVTKVFNV